MSKSTSSCRTQRLRLCSAGQNTFFPHAWSPLKVNLILWMASPTADQAFLRDADRKRRAGTNVRGVSRACLRRTRDVTFDAEDTLDDLILHRQKKWKIWTAGASPSWRTPVRYLISFFTRMIDRRGLSDEITSRIKSILLQHISENQRYGYGGMPEQHTPSVALTSSTTAIAAWRDDLENAVGFDKDLEILRQMLVHEHEDSMHQRFISIVGESGAGKNTLVKLICNQICARMDVFIRYDMQPGSNIEDLLTNVYRMALRQSVDQCHELEVEKEGIDSISDKIRGLLSRKRYLLILGGISSKIILNCLMASLPDDDGNGSRVMLILDTASEEVACHANTMNREGFNGVHLMTSLDQGRSVQLFYWKVLRKAQYESWLLAYEKRRNQEEEVYRGGYNSMRRNQKEEEEARQDDNLQRSVHNVTGGCPMAIVLLAGFLRFKEKPIQWNTVMHPPNHGYHPQQQCSTRRGMETIFWTSFEDLPDDLKSCFLYLAADDSCQDADEIVQMWIAEGFIINKSLRNGKTLEEVGHDYLKELVLRCLVELEETKADGSIGVVRVHRSLLGFLRSEITESGFMEIVHHVDIHDVIVPSPSVRRLSVQSDKSTMYTTHHKFPKLRSFICRIDEKHHEEAGAQQRWKKRVHDDLKFLHWSKFLRVVSVKGLGFVELPDELGDMIHLRYMRIDCPDLRYLPPSIARLINLQTLDISMTQVEEIDQSFWKIKTLRHVLTRSLLLPAMPVSASVKGEEYDDTACGELQTLHGVKPATSGSGEWSLLDNNMTRNLRSLKMHGFQWAEHGGPAFKAALRNMHLLDHLSLQGDKIPSCVFTEPSLRCLQSMELHGNVKWDDIILPVSDRLLRKVRPNLIQLKMNAAAISEMPQSIKQQLKEILILG
ncbi:unnamed protein product [Alopecurus aequalis]